MSMKEVNLIYIVSIVGTLITINQSFLIKRDSTKVLLSIIVLLMALLSLICEIYNFEALLIVSCVAFVIISYVIQISFVLFAPFDQVDEYFRSIKFLCYINIICGPMQLFFGGNRMFDDFTIIDFQNILSYFVTTISFVIYKIRKNRIDDDKHINR